MYNRREFIEFAQVLLAMLTILTGTWIVAVLTF